MTVWPSGSTATPEVTDEYGWRVHPITGVWTFHYGIDLVGFTYNRSPADGVVIFASYNGGAGNEVRVQAANGDTFRIKHNASFLVSYGQYVAEGQAVGVMGTTGASTGVHCHEEIWINNNTTHVNPRDYMAAALAAPAGDGATPIPEDDMSAEDVKAVNEHTDSANKVVLTALANVLNAILDAVRRDNNGRLLFDSGARNTVPFEKASRAAITREGKLWILPDNPVDRQAMVDEERASGSDLFFAKAEKPKGLSTTAYNRQLEWEAPTGAAGTTLPVDGLGTFVENVIELEEGITRQVYTERTDDYPNRQAVHRDGRRVRITKGGRTVERFVRQGGKSYALTEGFGIVELTATEVARADAQRPSKQTWAPS